MNRKWLLPVVMILIVALSLVLSECLATDPTI